ncbi:MAG: glycine cleavage system protein GcvH [Chloroflexota bacterium]
MSNIPADLKYTKEDEWIAVEDGVATIGITDYAQDSLADVVYFELPEVGDTLAVGDEFGVVESVKAAADLYAPVSGEVVATNSALEDAPELANSDPYGEAWIIKIKMSNPADLEALMDAAAYKEYLDSRA